MKEPKGRRPAWTEERGTSDEGRRGVKGGPEARGDRAREDRAREDRAREDRAREDRASIETSLYQVSQAVLSVTRQMSVRDVLQVIVRSARSLVGARYAALGVPDEGDSFAEFVVDGMSSAEWQAIGPLPRRHGMLAVLLNEGQPERLADIRKDPRFE